MTFPPGCLKKVTKTDWNADLGIVNVIKGGHTFLEWKLKKKKDGALWRYNVYGLEV